MDQTVDPSCRRIIISVTMTAIRPHLVNNLRLIFPLEGQTGNQTLELHYTSMPLTVENTGHSLLVPNFANNKITICGTSDCKDYRLVQFHFHTPSEHTLDDTSYAMEGHFVHMSSSGQLAVVAVMMNDSSDLEGVQPAERA